MNPLDIDSSQSLESLRASAREEANLGHFQTALALNEEVIARAQAHGDQEALDMARCNRGGLLIIQDRGGEAAGELRQILLRSTVPANCFLAAFNLSRLHELQRQTDRSLFYARLALGHAKAAHRRDFLILGYNQIGNLQLIDCRFEPACESYQEALRLSAAASPERALTLSNLGYCRTVLGRHREAFGQLFASLRLMRRLRSDWEMLPRMGLSYAYLDLRKPHHARKHASRALRLADTANNREHIMNSLYLLGESEKLLGDELAAYEHFHRLQRDFYPEQPFVADFLMATDIRQLINLMA